MKTIITIVAVFLMIAPSSGQGLQSRRTLGARLARPCAQSNERFSAMYSSGTNKFGRTFEQQVDFEKNFDVKSFLGFEFGKQYSGAEIVKLNKPYRLFDKVKLHTTVLGRLSGLRLEKEVKDVTKESLSNEVRKVAANLESVYQIPLVDGRWGDRNLGNYSFNSPIVEFGVYGTYSVQNGTGSICLWLSKPCLGAEDWKAREDELQKEMSEKGKSINIPDGEGVDLLMATEPNIAQASTNETGTIRGPRLFGGGLLGGSLRARRLQRQQEAEASAEKRKEEQVAMDAERQAQAERDRQQREAERAEQRQQLLAIQSELNSARETKAAPESKTADQCKSLVLKSFAGFEFGTTQKDFNYLSFPDLYDAPEVVLKKPIRYFVTAKLGYTAQEKKLRRVNLYADARGVSKDQFNEEMEKVRGILERKYKTPFVEGTPDLSGFKRFEFENARYCIRLFRDETVDRRPCMVLSVRDKAIKDSMTLEWSLGKEVDMERF